MLMPMKDPDAMIGLVTLRGEGKICRTFKTEMHPQARDSTILPFHFNPGSNPVMLVLRYHHHHKMLLCTMRTPICHHHHKMLVLHQLTSPMLPTHRQVMHQAHVATKVALLAMKVAIKVTKVGLVATCRVAQLLPIRATLDIMVDQDTQVATCLCLRSKVVANPLSKVATHLLTKVVIKTMVAQQATKASQATRAITAQIYHRMRGGMELGVITSRTLLEEKMCRSKYELNSVVFFLFSEALSAYIS
jgi:hypothetical protein